MDVLNNVASIVQLVSFAIFLWAAGLLFVRSRRYRQKLARLEETETPRPVALAVGLAGMDISEQVKGFLEDKGLNLEVRTLYHPAPVTRESFSEILHEILRIKRELTQARATEVYLFLGAPMTMAVAIGSLLDNWVPLRLYHFTRGTYEYHATLYKETVIGEGDEGFLERLYGEGLGP